MYNSETLSKMAAYKRQHIHKIARWPLMQADKAESSAPRAIVQRIVGFVYSQITPTRSTTALQPTLKSAERQG